MKDYGIVKSDNRPQEVEIKENEVFVASNIQPYEEEMEGHVMSGYKYNYKVYSKDEYYSSTIAALQEELTAAKILLGVE